MDVLTCMTGATRFLQDNSKYPNWHYLKDEEPEKLATKEFWSNVDFALTSDPELPFAHFDIVGSVFGFSGVKIHGLDSIHDHDLPIGGRRVARLLSRFTPGHRWPVVRMKEMVYVLWNSSRGRKYNTILGSGKAGSALGEEEKASHDEV